MPTGEALAVLVGAGDGEPERLLRISRPIDGQVDVLEWSGADWTSPARQRRAPATELLAELERAAEQRRRMTESIYRLRLWLEGQG